MFYKHLYFHLFWQVQVTYEGVKEVRSIKQQFFPLLFHLTRGEPENIAKAIAAIKPVYKILSDRYRRVTSL